MAELHQSQDSAEEDVRACDLSRKRKLDQLDLQSNVPYPKDDVPEELCSKCQKIDFEAALQIPDIRRKTYGVVVAELGRKGIEWDTTTCPICRLFAAVCIQPAGKSTTNSPEYHLRALPFLRTTGNVFSGAPLPEDLKKADSACFMVLSGKGRNHKERSRGQQSLTGLISHSQSYGVICPVVSSASETPPRVGARRLLSDRIDYHLLRNWYGFCAQNHRQKCAFNNREYPDLLKVIDCRTRRIIGAPPSCSYVALSYVWGKQKSTMVSSSVSPSKDTGHCTLSSITIPSVISDAIIVTLELGLQYLWVDRYCIDQNDEEKHFQINQMDRIYLCAMITLVAAAGESANHGLPGVSNTLRRAQPCAVVREQMLACTMRSARKAIRSSRWATRGWTYQEAALSVRRLVFTEEQVFFECKCMSCSESCSVPLALLHKKNLEHGCRECIQQGYFEWYDYGTASRLSTPEKYWTQVEQFTARELSYETDSLNAFMGVANYYRNGQGSQSSPLYTHIGLPLDSDTFSSAEQPSSCGALFVLTLLWEHSRKQVLPKRRQGFPSFSWAGWEGVASRPRLWSYRVNVRAMARIVRDPGIDTELSTPLGATLDLEADTVQGQIEISDKSDSRGPHTSFRLTKWEKSGQLYEYSASKPIVLPRGFLSRHKLSRGQIFLIDCVLMIYETLSNCQNFVHLLLIEYHGTIAERIGVTYYYCLSEEQFRTLPKTRRRIRLG